jgi:hypothetical protein
VKVSRLFLFVLVLLGALMTHASSTDPPTKKNRLADSKSPYLLQHADNPVDWYPWGPEAFAKAAEEDTATPPATGATSWSTRVLRTPRWRP